MVTIRGILSDLYKLSFKVRLASSEASSSLRIKSFRDANPDTGVDKISAYYWYNRRYVKDTLLQLRRDTAFTIGRVSTDFVKIGDSDRNLIDRLTATMNLRRRTIQYRRRHAEKLAAKSQEIRPTALPLNVQRSQEMQVEKPVVVDTRGAKSPSFTPRSHAGPDQLSATEHSVFNRKLDEEDVESVVSYASTANNFDLDCVTLPEPPWVAADRTKFLCPYCGIICPVRTSKPRN